MTDQTTPRTPGLLPIVIVAIALVAAAVVGSLGLVSSKRADRYVTVKGLSEMEVTADRAIWPITVSVPGNDLGAVQQSLDASLGELREFLTEFGIATEDISSPGAQLTDRAAFRYSNMEPGQTRYVVSQTLRVNTTDLDAVDGAARQLGQVIAAGVPIATPDGYGEMRPTYVFTGLNDIKPAMIAEATANARESAQQFANDSDSELGGIRRADQGVFQILPRIPGTPESFERLKRVRVVSTIQYYLDR